MLGSLKSATVWKWAAFGKHPVAGDYFYAGPDDPYFQAFSGWIESGYRQVCTGSGTLTDLHSWRFWTRGQKDTLICGIGRDSFDTIGRPYPLLVMGAGNLPEWQSHLALLPFALEKIWIQMEYLATKRYISFSQMENDVQRLPVPIPQWSGLQSHAHLRRQAWLQAGDPQHETIRKTIADTASEPVFLASFNGHDCLDAISAAGLWQDALTKMDVDAPNAAFLGGIPSATFLAVFRRPLGTPDFIRLWSVGCNINLRVQT
jgi:type VI secretion system protein VasJ